MSAYSLAISFYKAGSTVDSGTYWDCFGKLEIVTLKLPRSTKRLKTELLSGFWLKSNVSLKQSYWYLNLY